VQEEGRKNSHVRKIGTYAKKDAINREAGKGKNGMKKN